jgi:hypothetical protein
LILALTACIIAFVVIYLCKISHRHRKLKLIMTMFQLTLYAGEDKLSLPLDKSAFKETDTTEFISPNNPLQQYLCP